ncbi:YegP family protein [Arthrobacter sp. CDRTa11]|uniref:YegP family protein n=1 Tax=Arthrobacter sp. CDRTa11 TaxID=2651199 RepID=UPI0022658001|nr:YegP family protein [Arthrobacter sp. CDRTa11]UZX04360.1 YegP family protein [Arthrobacter sp. CDRTa11]
MSGSFELFCDHTQSFGFRLKAADGSVVAVSAPFPDKASAVQGIRDVRECAGMGLITDLCGSAEVASADRETRRTGPA